MRVPKGTFRSAVNVTVITFRARGPGSRARPRLRARRILDHATAPE